MGFDSLGRSDIIIVVLQNLVSIGMTTMLSQTITGTNAELLFIGHSGTKFSFHMSSVDYIMGNYYLPIRSKL